MQKARYVAPRTAPAPISITPTQQSRQEVQQVGGKVIIQSQKYDIGEVELAQRLIFQGKTYATAGDPRMRRLVNNLLEMGYQSAERKIAAAKARVVIPPPQTTKLPPGSWTPEMLSEFKKYPTLPGESQHERATRITTDPAYQKQLLELGIRPGAPAKLKIIEGSISPWKAEYGEQYYDKPPSQVAKEFSSIMWQNIKQIPKREQDFRNPFLAFKGSGRRTSEIKSSQYSPIIKPGTISLDESPYYTYGELQAEQDLSKQVSFQNVLNKYQSEADKIKEKLNKDVQTGKISVEKANEKLDNEIIKINKKMNTDLDKIENVRYFRKGVQTGDIVYSASKQIPALASLSTPATSVLYGAYLASESEKKAPIIIESKEKGVPLYFDVKVPLREKIESSLFIGACAFGTLGKMRKIESSIVQDELMRLADEPFKFKGTTIKTNKGDISIIQGVQKYNKLKTDVNIIGRTTQEGKYGYMSAGTGEAKVTGELSWNVLGGGKPTYIANVQRFRMGGKGLTFQTGKTGELFLGDFNLLARGKLGQGVGSTTIIPTERTGIIFQTTRARPYLNFPSSKIRYLTDAEIKSKAKFISEELTRSYKIGGTITKDLGSTLSLKLPKNRFFVYTSRGDVGTIKVIYPKLSSEVKIFRGGLGKKSSQEYIQSLYATTPDLLQPLSKSTTESTIKLIPKPSTNIVPFVSAAATTIKADVKTKVIQYPIGVNRFQDMTGGSKFKDIRSSRFGDLGVMGSVLVPETKSLAKLKIVQTEKQKEESISIGKTKTISLLKPAEKQKEALKSLQKSSLRLKQRQVQKQLLEQLSLQRLMQKQKVTTKTPTPIIPIIAFPKLSGLLKDIKKGKVKDKDIFKVFSKRFGKPLDLGKFETQKESEKKLKSYLKQTLGASGQIFKNDKPLKFWELKTFFGREWRPAKKDMSRIVQRSPFRLTKGDSQVQEIQYFKKKSKKKSNNFLDFF